LFSAEHYGQHGIGPYSECVAVGEATCEPGRDGGSVASTD